MNEFYQLIQDTVSRSPIGAKAVAVKIGKPYSTSMNNFSSVNIYDDQFLRERNLPS